MTLYYSNIENKRKTLNSYNRMKRRQNNEIISPGEALPAMSAFSTIEEALAAQLDPSGGDQIEVSDVADVADVADEVIITGGKNRPLVPTHIKFMNGMIRRNFKPINDDLTKRHAIIIKRLNKIENLIIAILCILILIALKIYS